MTLRDTIRNEGARLLEVAAGNISVPIPRYRGWNMLDLLVHTGAVHGRTVRIVREKSTEPLPRQYPTQETPAFVVPWFRAGYMELADVLATTDQNLPVWTFGPPQTVAFWQRRMQIETAVHRWDAENAIGLAAPLSPTIAEMAIDEFGLIHLAGAATPQDDMLGTSVGLADPAGGLQWILTSGEMGVRLARGSGQVEAVITAGASDLYLWLAGRLDISGLDYSGRDDVLNTYVEAIASISDADR